MYNIRIKLCAALFLCFGCIAALNAQITVSPQSHFGSVSCMASARTTPFDFPVYSASDDGFIIKWTAPENGEHFQISDYRITALSVHPNGNDIAVVETDGFSLYRISVWDWKNQTRKWVKRLNGTVSSFAYSAKGSFLLIGMSDTNGIVFMDSSNGRILTGKSNEYADMASFVMTSASENSCIVYSPAGQLSYLNLKNGKLKTECITEPDLTQTCLFSDNILFAGVKNDTIYIFRADTGELELSVQAKKPLLCTSPSDKNLYYVETDGKNIVLKMTEIENGRIKPQGLIVKTAFFEKKEKPTSFIKINDSVYIGTDSGEVYTLDTQAETQTYAVSTVSNRVYDKIYDIAEYDGLFYFLTSKTVFKSSYEDNTVYSFFSHNGYTDIIPQESTLILWAKNTKKPVLSVNEQGSQTLFTPQQNIQILHVQHDKLVYVEGSTKVKIFDLQSGKVSQPYTGTGIQDALLYTPELLYVVKSAASNPKGAIVQVDTKTKETVSINTEADVAFSLSQNKTENGPFYGVALSAAKFSAANANGTNGGQASAKGQTEIFAYYPETKKYSPIFRWADEDANAFTWIHNGTLFTNVGKMHIHAYDIAERTDTLLQRSSALPLKITGTEHMLAVLNKDGSVSWYDGVTKQPLKSWYITNENEWLEF